MARQTRLLKLCAASLLVLSPTGAAGDWLEEIGHARLVELGIVLPSSSGTGLSQVEAFENEVNYTPDTTSTQFAGKTFKLKSGDSGVSNHADKVARNFYGSSSLLPGASAVDLYSAGNWLGSGFLLRGTSSLPLSESRAVQNHSWISTTWEDADATEVNHRLDYAIHNKGFIAVVGMNNGNTTSLPKLLGQAYHVISVGRDDGAHSAGITTLDGTGRIKPDLVAPSASPNNATSWTTPMVAGSAGVLRARLTSSPYSLSGANVPRVVKALLMATATKDTLPTWSNTTDRPLDLRYGAGELNLHHAWLAMLPGRATASSATQYGLRRWAAESVAANASKTWFFRIPAGAPATPFCAALTWHRVVTSSSSGFRPRTWSSTLANLDLHLHAAAGLTIGSEIVSSASTVDNVPVDNVELIHQPALPPGDYALVVQNLSGDDTDMALAWHSLPGVTIQADDPLACEIDGKQGMIVITRKGDTNAPLKVPLSIGGTAVPGVHYQPLPASVVIPTGQSAISLPLTPIGDSLAQGNRTVTAAIAADFALVRDPAQSATIVIEDKPFDAWRFANFSNSELADPSISGETADADHDDFANLLEFALDLAPKSPDASPLTAGTIEGRLFLQVGKNPDASDIDWSAEVSGDLATWQAAETIENTNTFFEARDIVDPAEHDRRFIRLKIARQ